MASLPSSVQYNATLKTPFAVLGIVIEEGVLASIAFLPPNFRLRPPKTALAKDCAAQLQAYLRNPRFNFDLPLKLAATAHRLKVWGLLRHIPPAATRTYGDIAQEIQSSPRAVGQACGANPFPIIIPCHRVLATSGIGGFMHSAKGSPIGIKQWLLQHEQRAQ